ncbi:MAG: GxxExxY protein [Patescibacteria group bacterium]
MSFPDVSNNIQPVVRRADIILPELSYKIVGTLFDVYNDIGFGHLERVYQAAVAGKLSDQKINFIEQVPVVISSEGKEIGKYYLDFLINDSIILELKQGKRFNKTNYDQVNAYLISKHLQLAILASFTPQGVIFKRLVNLTN